MPAIFELLQQGLARHQAGDLAEAQAIYREILRQRPQHADAWHLLGLTELASARLGAARDCIARAIEADPNQAPFHNHLAEALRRLGDLSAATQSCRTALALDGDYAVAHNTLGLVQQAQGALDEAIASFAQAATLDPQLAQAHGNLGEVLLQAGRPSEAVLAFRRALECQPPHPRAAGQMGAALEELGDVEQAIAAFESALESDSNQVEIAIRLGTLQQQRGRKSEAMRCYQHALALDEARPEVHCNLGSLLKDQSRFDDAIARYQRALELDPDLPEAHFNLGVIHQHERRLEAAIACYERAISARPNYPHAHNNLGTIYKMLDNLPAAKACYERALQYEPNFAEALNNLGNTFKSQGNYSESLQYYERSLQAKPDYEVAESNIRMPPLNWWAPPPHARKDYPQAHYNRALANLGAGNFEEGWPEYEWRWRCPEFTPKHVDRPTWDGQPLAGRTLLVHAEQGLGDTLQFARYVRLLAQAGARVLFEVQPALLPLLRQSCFDHLFSSEEPPPEFDVHVPLLTLPLLFQTTLETIPQDVPYLHADPALLRHWQMKLAPLPGKKIGIAWQGNPSHAGDRQRSFPVRSFQPLAEAGATLISLQVGPGLEQLGEPLPFPLHQLGPEVDKQHGRFMDTAAVMKTVDLVVTCDTATAHLAGGLGVPTWVALACSPDWRWLQQRADCPWYPTLRLFRQTSRGDWGSVFSAMAAQWSQQFGGA